MIKEQKIRHRAWRSLLLIALTALVVFLTAGSVLVADGLTDELGKADAGLVLGTTVNRDGTPSRRLAARLERALYLYREGYFELVVVSGAVGKESRDEANVMRNYLLERGIPARNVVVDNRGTSTYASAMNAKELFKARRLDTVLVISQYFHISRAKLALRRSSFPRVYSAHAKFFELRDLYSIPREVVAYLQYTARSYGAQTLPSPSPSRQRSRRP